MSGPLLQSHMISFQASPVDIRITVRRAYLKERKLACTVSPLCVIADSCFGNLIFANKKTPSTEKITITINSSEPI